MDVAGWTDFQQDLARSQHIHYHLKGLAGNEFLLLSILNPIKNGLVDGDRLKEFLSIVSKPVRYLGHEIHSIKKDPTEVRLKFCMAFPDVYEVGMSHLGLQILYHVLITKKGIACERAFAPWVDMEKVLRGKQIPLSSLESSTSLNQLDIVGFSLQYGTLFHQRP